MPQSPALAELLKLAGNPGTGGKSLAPADPRISGRRPSTFSLDDDPEVEASTGEIPLWRKILAGGARVVGTMGGAALGTLAMPGAGTIGGGAVGAGLGETAGEWIEGRKLNPSIIALQSLMGGVPIPGGGLASTMVKNAGMGAINAGASRTLEQGVPKSWSDAEDLGMDMVGAGTIGAVTSGALHGLGARFKTPAEPPPPVPPVPRAPRDVSMWQSPAPTEGLSFQPPDPGQLVPPSRGPIPGRTPRALDFGPAGSEALTPPLTVSAPDEVEALIRQARGGPRAAGPDVGTRVAPEGGVRDPRVQPAPKPPPPPRQPMPPLQGRAIGDLHEPTQSPLFGDSPAPQSPAPPSGPPSGRSQARGPFGPFESDPLDELDQMAGSIAKQRSPAEEVEALIHPFTKRAGERLAEARANGPVDLEMPQQSRTEVITTPTTDTAGDAALRAKPVGRASTADTAADSPAEVIARIMRGEAPAAEQGAARTQWPPVEEEMALSDIPTSQGRKEAMAQRGRYNFLTGKGEDLAATGTGGSSNEAGFLDLSGAGKVLPTAKEIEQWRMASMLSSPETHLASNLPGGGYAIGRGAFDKAVDGDFSGAGNIIKQLFSGQTIGDFQHAWKNPSVNSRHGINVTGKGVLSMPGRALGAVDDAVKGVLRRGGVSQAEAENLTMTNQPRSTTGAAFNKLAQTNGLTRFLVPFSKTATNLVERGIEHIPGVGLLDDVRAMSNPSTRQLVAKQLLGTAALAEGAMEAPDKEDPYHTSTPERIVSALLGGLALPRAIGRAARGAVDSGTNPIIKGLDAVADAVPTPSSGRAYDPGTVVSSYIPNILRDMGSARKNSQGSSVFDTSWHKKDGAFDAHNWLRTILGPAAAKLPGLNDALLTRKRGAAGRDKER